MNDKTKALVDLLRTAAMDRILERALERAEEELPEREESAANPGLVYRAHYAAQAEQCREEIAAINAITAALAALDEKVAIGWVVTIRETRLLPAIHWAAQHNSGRERHGFSDTVAMAVRESGQATQETA